MQTQLYLNYCLLRLSYSCTSTYCSSMCIVYDCMLIVDSWHYLLCIHGYPCMNWMNVCLYIRRYSQIIAQTWPNNCFHLAINFVIRSTLRCVVKYCAPVHYKCIHTWEKLACLHGIVYTCSSSRKYHCQYVASRQINLYILALIYLHVHFRLPCLESVTDHEGSTLNWNMLEW